MTIEVFKAQLSHWTNMFTGESYWHAAQGLGPCFKPEELLDYYRNYSTKIFWKGAVDGYHLPLVEEPGGMPFHHPIVLAQKALGHYSSWLSSDRKEECHLKTFLQLCRWLVDAQDPNGGWKVQSMDKPAYTVPYSAMVQGQAISVLVRGFLETSEGAYLGAANNGMQFMLRPISDGGTCRKTGEGLVLEEYPKRDPNTVLNGWISAFYGLYDLFLLTHRPEVQEAMELSLKALLHYLPRFDAGYWSYYDTLGTLASPYYHRVHITQLRALELTFPHQVDRIVRIRKRFERQLSSRTCSLRAILTKGMQKLKNPPESMFVQSKPSVVSRPSVL